MLCSKCGKKEATVHTVTEINGVRSEQHLCAECAQKDESVMSMFSRRSLFGDFFDMTERLAQLTMCGSGLVSRGFTSPYERQVSELFDSVMLPVLRGDGSKATAKAEEPKKEKSKIEELKARLEAAIKEERFEDCAKLRDEIAKLSKEGEN